MTFFINFLQSVRDRKAGTMKAAVVAKLAQQTYVYYNAVKDASVGSVLSPVLDPSWSHHAEYQSRLFAAGTEYWQATAVKESAVARGSGYGEEITRLGLAERHLRQALEIGQRNKLAGALIASGETFLNSISSMRQKAITENNTIYMDSIPLETSIGAVAGVSMVRPSSMPEYYNAEKPYFKDILPKELRLLRGEFRDEIAAILRTSTENAENALNSGRGALNAIGLPGSLDTYRSGGKLSENLIQKFGRIVELGGRSELQTKWDELEAASRRAMQTMSTIEDTLQREEKTDGQFRAKYPTWTGTASIVLTTEIRSTNSRMRDAYSAARDSDQGIQRELSDPVFDYWLKLACGPVSAIVAMIPTPPPALLDFTDISGTDAASGVSAAHAHTLDKLLTEMTGLIEQRERCLSRIREVHMKDITEELLANVSVSSGAGAGAHPSTICNDYKRTCSEQEAIIVSSIERQNILIIEISKTNDIFQQSLATDAITVEREKLLRELEQTVTRYFSLHAMISAGITFYSNLQVFFGF